MNEMNEWTLMLKQDMRSTKEKGGLCVSLRPVLGETPGRILGYSFTYHDNYDNITTTGYLPTSRIKASFL
jgi:hypothetical protein